MQFEEADTGAPITAEMLRNLVEALGQSPETDFQFGVEFIVHADRLNDAISILEQLAAQM